MKFKARSSYLYLLAFGLSAYLSFLTPSAQAGINDGLIAHYPFDGNANDVSGNGNHGTAFNNFSYESGVVNDAIHLVGSGHTGLGGGHVLLPSLPLDTMPEFTIGMWVKYEGQTTSPGGESFIVPTMGLKPSPSGETFRFFGDKLDYEAWKSTERVRIRVMT